MEESRVSFFSVTGSPVNNHVNETYTHTHTIITVSLFFISPSLYSSLLFFILYTKLEVRGQIRECECEWKLKVQSTKPDPRSSILETFETPTGEKDEGSLKRRKRERDTEYRQTDQIRRDKQMCEMWTLKKYTNGERKRETLKEMQNVEKKMDTRQFGPFPLVWFGYEMMKKINMCSFLSFLSSPFPFQCDFVWLLFWCWCWW